MHLSPAQLKVVLLLSLLQDLTLKRQSQILIEHLEADLERCEDCFAAQLAPCQQLYETLADPTDLEKLVKAIALRFDRRHIYWLQLSHNQASLLAKRAASPPPKDKDQPTVDALQRQFYSYPQRPGRFQFCSQSPSNASRFVAFFQQRGYSELTIWYYMVEHITPLLMHELWSLRLPVPRSYAACGLTHLQAYAGRTLSEFEAAALPLRCRLAQQLLELALEMTFGFDNFRIYITDFTVYNFAYDDVTQQLTVIDLDTVIVVDAAETLLEAGKYVVWPGEDFSYDLADFCTGRLSDANIYQASRLLQEFLLPDVADEQPELYALLDSCVTCVDDLCDLRFQCAYDLIKMLKQILEHV